MVWIGMAVVRSRAIVLRHVRPVRSFVRAGIQSAPLVFVKVGIVAPSLRHGRTCPDGQSGREW